MTRDKAVELLARALKRVCTEWLHVIDGEDHFFAIEATALLDRISPMLVAAEREACAKLAESLHETSWPDTIAAAIRARSEGGEG